MYALCNFKMFQNWPKRGRGNTVGQPQGLISTKPASAGTALYLVLGTVTYIGYTCQTSINYQHILNLTYVAMIKDESDYLSKLIYLYQYCLLENPPKSITSKDRSSHNIIWLHMAFLLITFKPYAFTVYESYSNMTRDQRYCLLEISQNCWITPPQSGSTTPPASSDQVCC